MKLTRFTITAIVLFLVFSLGAVAIVVKKGRIWPLTDAQDHPSDIATMLKNRDLMGVRNLAWNNYMKGDFTGADGLVDKLLYQEEWELDSKMKADCYYLKGSVLRKWGNQPEAISFFYRAEEIYERIGHTTNEYRVKVATAKVYVDIGDLGLAKGILEDVEDMVGDKPRDLMDLYKLRAEVAFAYSDWEAALEQDKLILELAKAENDEYTVAGAISDMGLHTMLMGDFELGRKYTTDAQQRILSIGDTNTYYYNLINMVFAERCSPEGSKQKFSEENMIIRIQSRIERERDADLRWYLDFAKTYDCPTEKTTGEVATDE